LPSSLLGIAQKNKKENPSFHHILRWKLRFFFYKFDDNLQEETTQV
jgi:hypothetical protein